MPPFDAPPMPADGIAVQRIAAVPEAGGRRHVAILMAGSCLPILGAVLLSPVLSTMQDHFAAVPHVAAMITMVLTGPALMLAVLAPLAGVLIDWLGRKRLLVVATVLYSFFGTAPLWLHSLRDIVASRALLGIAEAFIMTSCTTLIGDYYTGRVRDRYLALQTVCGTASATVFYIVGGALGSPDWRTPFWLYAAGLLLTPIMAVFLPGSRLGTAVPEPATQARPFPLLRLAGICLLTVFGATVFYTVPVETPILLNNMGVTSTGLIGMVIAIASAATVAGCVTFASLPGRPQRRLPAVFGACGVGFLLMAVGHNTVLLVVGGLLTCVGTGFLLPSLLTWAMSELHYGNRGRGTGLWTGSFFLGQFLCPVALSAAQSATGGLATAVRFLGLASLLVAAVLLPVLRRAKDA
ncbi:MFS transporter [Streptomyces sp. NPDC048179]|uniref:MFS transporter n=1 Tax=Streptomyces sp. NPDC048179 TaxID=3365506 RepID=UPI0037115E61